MNRKEEVINKLRDTFRMILCEQISKKVGLSNMESICNKFRENDFIQGYYFGVKSIILKQKSHPYDLKAESLSKEEIRYLLNKLMYYSDDRFIDNFNKGYLNAWIDYLKYYLEQK